MSNIPALITYQEAIAPLESNQLRKAMDWEISLLMVNDTFELTKLPENHTTGDSGGPLITQSSDGRWIQVGIVSFGYQCAVPEVPGFYTKLANYVDWITQTTTSSEC
ncbi:hypothetical protein SK128_005498 [Halocaridina rubra]|uniref:Peptidase S1 domain-containing protein n=1 Tax=Halocaridina rubra TaxID=373956 RepID=A0AAN8XDS7_HALRR